jgi:hypothetical protein
MKTILAGLMLAICAWLPSAVIADSNHSEGPVSQVVSIRVHAGHMDQYMAYLATTWKNEREALKKAGVIQGYAVYQTTPRTADDPNLYLVTQLANMAALDGLDDRSDAVLTKATGMSNEAAEKAMADRNAIRTIVGQEVIRELVLK